MQYILQDFEDTQKLAEILERGGLDYSDAYVLDICRTDDGLKIIETNCINAAGFYAADLGKLVSALEEL